MLPDLELDSTEEFLPIFALGTWAIRDPRAMERTIRRAIDEGLWHIDTAEMYEGAEEVVGRAVRGRRDEVFITTKVLPQNASFRGTIAALERSLRKLRTDYVDLYLLHWYDGSHPLGETMEAFAYLMEQGKIAYAGVSNFSIGEMEEALKYLKVVNNQVEYNLGNFRHVEEELLPYAESRDITLSGYLPLWRGRWPSGRRMEVLKEVADKYGMSVPQVILNFLTRHRKIIVIFKTESEEHLLENLKSVRFRIEQEDYDRIAEAFRGEA